MRSCPTGATSSSRCADRGSFLEERSETARLLQLRALGEELEVHLRSELDFVEEAANTALIARSVEEYDDLVVPQVIRPLVTERVLVLERIDGKKVTAEHGLPEEQAGRLAPTSSAATSAR